MNKELPKKPSLEHLKNEAKALLRSAKSGETQELTTLKLSAAQHAVANHYGFKSWAKLKFAVENQKEQSVQFFSSIRAGNRQRIEELLDENPALIHSYDDSSFGARPIPVAAQRADRPMIDLLLERGADINALSDWEHGGFGALDLADKATCDYLLGKGAALTPHAAARLGMAQELRQLLAQNPGAVHKRGGDGQFPLHFAKTPEIVDILVNAGAELDARDLDHCGTPAQTRIRDTEVLRRLVERGATPDIFIAIALDELDLVLKLVKDDPGVLARRTDEPGNHMIATDAPGSHIYTYNLGWVRPFQAALLLGKTRIYDELVRISEPKLQFLAACIKPDRTAALKLVNEHPSLVKELGPQELQLLPEAARSMKLEAVKLMLELGFDINAVDKENMTTAHWAVFHGRGDILQLALDAGANLELKNGYGGTVINCGCYGSEHGWNRFGNHARTTEMLLAAGAVPPPAPHGNAAVKEVLKRHLGLE